MIDWFEEYEGYPIVEKSQIKWNFTKDFQVQSKYIVDCISSIISRLDGAKDDELLGMSQQCYNLLSWTNQMSIMGFTGLQQYIDELLIDNFADKDIILKLQRQSFAQWAKDKAGNYKLGENYFVFHDGNAYYKKLTNTWYLVDTESIFNLTPEMSVIEGTVVTVLDSIYKPSVYHQIYSEWQDGEYTHAVPGDFFDYTEGESTPENELEKSLGKIKRILAEPVSLQTVQSNENIDEEHLEYLIKVSYLMAQFAQTRRLSDEHTLYLLRDCVIFYEIHKTLDILEDTMSSSDQLIAGRKLLSNSKREGGHWYFTQEALFFAYEKHPDDFDDFYEDYSEILTAYEAHSEEFREFIHKLAGYIDEHIPENLETDTLIDVVDLGFQGSINILIKYVIDNHCQAGKRHKTTIHMYVLAEWFKSIYPGMYSSETYSLLTNIEVLARNELMYDYKVGSFAEGNVAVVMGTAKQQELANTELLVTTMTTLIAKKLQLL